MKVGDKVAWVSQAQGCWKNKSGTVIADIPAGKDGQITHYYCPRKSVVVLIDSTE